jgi:transposase-like protein
MFSNFEEVEQIIAQGRDEEKDFCDLLREQLLGRLPRCISRALLLEACEYNNASYGQRCPAGRRDSLNGAYKRHLTIFDTQVTIRMPQTRKSGFKSSLIEAYKRRSAQIDAAIRNIYIAGASDRETSALLHQLTGLGVSKSVAANVVCGLDAGRKAFQTRPLCDDYLYLCLDGMHVRCMVAGPPKVAGANGGESIEKVVVLLVRGIRPDGTRETIDFRVAPGETEQAWESFLQDLWARGLQGANLKLVVHDGSTGLESALASVYGTGIVSQRCVCHKMANALDAASSKDPVRREELRSGISHIYQACDKSEAYTRLEEFIATWQSKESKAATVLKDGFEDTLGFFNVPQEHRRWIFTNNPIEREIREIRRRTGPMNTFMGLKHLNWAVFVGIMKTSDQRRKDIPYKLWENTPARDRPKKKVHPLADIQAKRSEFIHESIAGMGAVL